MSCFDETDIHQFGPWSICKYYCNLQYLLFTNEADVTSTGAARLATGFAKLWLTIFHVGAVLLPAMLRGLSWCCVEGQKCCRRNAFVSCLKACCNVTVHPFGRVGSTMIYILISSRTWNQGQILHAHTEVSWLPGSPRGATSCTSHAL